MLYFLFFICACFQYIMVTFVLGNWYMNKAYFGNFLLKIFIAICFQSIMIALIVGSWYTSVTYSNSSVFPLLFLHLLLPFHFVKVLSLCFLLSLLFCSLIIFTLYFTDRSNHVAFKVMCLIYFT